MKERLASLLRAMEAMEAIARGQGAEEEARQLSALRQRALAHRFHLLVVGQFKRGKSSVVNALLGAPVLPTGVLPLTAVATRIVYGESPQARVYLRDGIERTVPLSDLTDWVAETGNPGNRKGVTAVVVQFPAPILRGGLVLFDTPGVGSTIQENTQAAYESLPEADAALAVIGADPPLTYSELEYLRQATEHAARVWFLQNKVDALPEHEWRQALNYNRKSLAQALDCKEIELLPVSARLALEARQRGDAKLWAASGFAALEERLLRFLANERAAVFTASIARAARRLGERVHLALEVRRTALSLPAQTLSERKARLEERLRAVASKREIAVALFQKRVKGLVDQMEERLQTHRRQLAKQLEPELMEWVRSRNPLPRPVDVDQEVARRVGAAFLPWREAERSRLEAEFRSLALGFAADVNRLAQEVEAAFGELAGVRLGRLTGEEGFTVNPHFYLPEAVPETFFPEFSVATLTPVLPRSLALRVLQQRLRQRLAETVDQMSGRIRYDLAYRLQESARRFAGEINARLDSFEQEMRQILAIAEEKARQTEAQAAAAVAEVERERARLQELLAAIEPPASVVR